MVLLDHKNNSQQTNKHRNTSDSCALATRGALWSYPTGCTLYHPALDTYITAWICAVFSYSPDKKCSIHWACLIHSVRFNKHDICLYSQLHKDSKNPEYKQDSVCLDTSAFCNASSMMCLRGPEESVMYYVALPKNVIALQQPNVVLCCFCVWLQRADLEQLSLTISSNSIQDDLYSAFYDTIVAKQLHRKLSF